ncbi:MAG TPA: fused MFS/spermidine synthase, partial [Vicinamibacteria bacterium]|nr:fused MFS/spermidine synthase [Vicinamibacteria bacterium]
RRANSLRFYAALEAVVALTAAATPPLLLLARGAYLSLGGSIALGDLWGTVLRLLLAALVLLPPTFVAGGTLGAAAGAIEHEGDRRRRGTALLYGVNTLGAVAGCLAATFWLLEAFGTRATLWLAALVNLAIAGLAAWLGGRLAAPPAVETKPPKARTDGRAGAASPVFVLLSAAVVGFAFFLMELVWYRMLGPILGGTVYTFGLVLAMALVGIGVGGLLYSTVFARRAIGLPAFAVTCLLEAVAMTVPYMVGDRIALMALALRPPAGAVLGDYLGGWTLVTAIVVLPAAIVAGLQFPLLVALLGEGRLGVARHLGLAYLWNTAGGIAGSLAGGFGLLPILTALGCWTTAVLLLTALALVAMAADRRVGGGVLAMVGTGAVFVVGTLLVAEGPTAAWRHSAIGAGRASPMASPPGPNSEKAWVNDARRSVVWEREGVESSVAVQAVAGLSFVLNGKVDGNARNDAPTQVMSGVLGALLRPGARRSMVIGLGTGSTPGWLAAMPGMERTDVVELEPAILEVARMCGPVNRDAMDNPRMRVMTGDAREVLTVSRDRYDLVFSEPSNPYRAGVAGLFTREFYESVASRLEPDGLFLQWVQAYEVDERTVSSVVSTLASVFPEVEIWQVHHIDLLLVASRRPLRLDGGALRARLQEEPQATALRGAWRAAELEDVLARFVAGPALVKELLASSRELNTDDRNRVEFSFARTLASTGLFDLERLRGRAAGLRADRPAIDGPVDWGRVARQRLAIHTIAGATFTPPPDAPEEDRLRAKAHAQYLGGELSAAVTTLEGLSVPPEGPVETTIMAEGLAERGDPRAVPFIKALSAIEPTEAEAATARLALRMGQVELARDALAAAFVHYRTDPWPGQVSMSHALALADELTLGRPQLVGVLFEALGQPFAVAALEEPRRIIRLSVGSHGLPSGSCREAVVPFEPHVPWRADVLRFRATCYERTGDARALRARADLREFERQEPAAPTPVKAADGIGAARNDPF